MKNLVIDFNNDELSLHRLESLLQYDIKVAPEPSFIIQTADVPICKQCTSFGIEQGIEEPIKASEVLDEKNVLIFISNQLMKYRKKVEFIHSITVMVCHISKKYVYSDFFESLYDESDEQEMLGREHVVKYKIRGVFVDEQ